MVQFKQRYNGRISTLRSLDDHILDYPALAMDFIHKFDMRGYHELRKDCENGLYDKESENEKVRTLAVAYELASNYVVERRDERGMFCVFFAVGWTRKSGRSGERAQEERSGKFSDQDRSWGGGSRRWGPSAERTFATCQVHTLSE